MTSIDRAYDLVAIGSGPAGRGAAVQAARLGARVAVVERAPHPGGRSASQAALCTRVLRAAILESMGRRPLPAGPRAGEIPLEDLLWRSAQVVDEARQAVRDELRRARVDLLTGTASFLGPGALAVRAGGVIRTVRAERFVIAVGRARALPDGVALDRVTVLDPAALLRRRAAPGSVTVVGAGVAGIELASMLAALGKGVTVVDRRPRILDGVDWEIASELRYHLRGLGVDFRLGEEASAVEPRPGGGALVRLRSGDRLTSEAVLVTSGHRGAAGDLGLPAAGLRADSGGGVPVDDAFLTAHPHIAAAGGVAGPRGAVASAQQGVLAALAVLGRTPPRPIPPAPRGVHAIPEVASVGRSEDELRAASVPYVRGLARYRDLLRGGLTGDRVGLLKLLVHPASRRLFGAHVLGTSATEVIHVAQTVMAAGLPVDHLAAAPVDPATVADAYRLAAADAVARLPREPAPERAPAAACPNGAYGLATLVTAKEASR